MRRHAKDAADLRDLEFPCFEKLRRVIGNADGRKGHGLFEDGHLARVGGAAIGRVPALPQALGVFDCVGVRQHAGGHRAVAEEFRAVLLSSNAQPNGALLQRDGAVAHDAVETEAGDVQNVRGVEAHHAAFAGGVGVGQLAPAVAVDLHVVGQQRIQTDNAIAPSADNLGIGISPQEQMGKHRFTPDEGGHFRVGFVVQKMLQRMFQRLDAALVCSLKHIERQAGHGLSDDAYTGVNGGDLNGRARGDALAGHAAAKVKRWCGGDGVLR